MNYIQSAYKNSSGSLYWTNSTKTTTVQMSANGYSDSAAFTAGKDGSYIDSNSIIWVKESLLWQAFGNVIDPPLKVDSPKDTVIKKLEEIPLTNYLQAAIGRDLYGNQLSSTQRLDKLGIALD